MIRQLRILMVMAAFLCLPPFTAWAKLAVVPQTGQSTCYDTDGAVIPCAGTGQDGDNPQGVPWPETRFVDTPTSTGNKTANLTISANSKSIDIPVTGAGISNLNGNTGVAGATVTLSGTANRTATSAADGSYSFSGLSNGTYTVTPTLIGYTFTPTSYNVTLSNQDVTVPVFTPTPLITTVAGNGSQGYSGDNIPATSAALNYPIGVALDSAGNLYIADLYNSRIRMMAVGTGIITTVAGNWSQGYSGDNIPATSAALYAPFGVALDGTGNIYIADTGNNRIRKVAAGTGIITTVAGNGAPDYSGDNGPATYAALNGPTGVAVDSAGNLYIADYGNNRIRKVDIETEIITSVAGNGSEGYTGDNIPATASALYGPSGVALDSAGNLYIADNGNNRIRKVAAGSGIITTVAGNGTQGYTGDNIPAMATALYGPSGIALDSAGNLLIADTFNNRIRKAYGVVDTTLPAGGITINDNLPYTPSTSVTLNQFATDAIGVTGYYLSTSSVQPTPGADGWKAVTETTGYSANVPNTLPGGDGTKTVYVWYRDAAGNVSTTASDSIILDATPPIDGMLTATPGAAQIVLTWSGFSDATSGIAGYTLVYASGSAPATCTAGTQIYTGTATTFPHTGLANGTTYYYRLCAVDNAGKVSAGTTASSVTNPLLTATISGNGGGTVNSITDGVAFACSSGACYKTFVYDTALTLRAIPNNLSFFSTWSGDCSGTGDCPLTMTGNKTVTAAFTAADRSRIGAVGYSSLNAAYTAASEVGVTTILTLDVLLTESLTINKQLIISGGHNTTYTGRTGNPTVLKGALTIGKGSLVVEGVAVR